MPPMTIKILFHPYASVGLRCRGESSRDCSIMAFCSRGVV